ncbi:MAG: glycerol-3-phosphate 1-O-acyltransferase PlsY [Bacteroidetes bacterium]|jgi:glycerol-3-phosphate acyltransferase PlsY|nr:glycerol-3-phosphate 1-O-acyltransferase PlsY [Bacteroidota bacterium]
MFNMLLVVLLSYIVGSIPTAVMLSKWRHGFDIRTKGSGNAGGTNVFRVLGWKSGVFVMLVDALKGVVATTLVARLFWDPSLPFYNQTPFDDFTIVQIICGAAAIVGHVWTVFAGFRGGKGIATAAGMLLGVAPTEFAVSLTIFAVVFLASRYVSLGSIAAAVAFPLSLVVRYNILMDEIPSYGTLVYFSVGVALFLLYSHRTNIRRLIAGTEHKITSFSGKRSSEN